VSTATGTDRASAWREDVAAPLERSVRIALAWRPGWLWWGATWAFVCGVAAASPWDLAPGSVGRMTVGWLVAVPLLGLLWTRLLAPEGASDPWVSEPPPAGLEAPARRGTAWLLRARRSWPGLEGLGFLALLTGVATSLGISVVVVALVPLAAGATAVVVTGRRPGPVGFARSGFEILVPGLIGWLALGGAKALPPGLADQTTLAAAVARQAWQDWAFPGVLSAFTIIHLGATATWRGGRGAAAVVGGYLATVAILAVGSQTLAAGAVALLFLLQWPAEARLRGGDAVGHLRTAQWPTMLAMGIACLAAGSGP